jgi:DNA gyrase subunit A
MNNEEQLKDYAERAESDAHKQSDLSALPNSASSRIKVSDDLNSNEILVFTSHHNVYKVQKKELRDKFQALQKIDFEPEEKPIYLTGEKHYKGFLIVAFENGKIGKISMNSFQTEYSRKKLKNAFNNESALIFIELIDQDIDLVALSSIKKVVLFNTGHINAVESRTTKGVQVMKQKAGSSMTKVKRAEHAKLIEPEYYRKSEGLNVIGYYLKQGDEI